MGTTLLRHLLPQFGYIYKSSEKKINECILWESIGFIELKIKGYCVLFILCELCVTYTLK